MSDNERQKSIDKNVSGALLLAFYAYLDPDKERAKESIRVANVVMDACGYPRVPNVA
jgi:hypothetical protein